ncbi:hypothetical protein Bealeia2_01959 (plasmid) [Candidatus Bealeia paramacronuclearis]|nr:hypothetical protein [Candidatus Bealeia paramacronuclearis]
MGIRAEIESRLRILNPAPRRKRHRHQTGLAISRRNVNHESADVPTEHFLQNLAQHLQVPVRRKRPCLHIRPGTLEKAVQTLFALSLFNQTLQNTIQKLKISGFRKIRQHVSFQRALISAIPQETALTCSAKSTVRSAPHSYPER